MMEKLFNKVLMLGRFSLLAAAVVWLSACATVELTPEEKALKASPTATQVQKNVAASQGRKVRWTGSVIGVENLKEFSYIEMLSRMPSPSGRVDDSSATQGRVLVRVKGFVEPADYPVGRFITVVGEVDKILEKPVGEYVYPYVVIEMESIRLLKRLSVTPVAYPYPYYYPFYLHHNDVFYDPYDDSIFAPFTMPPRHFYKAR